MKRFPIGYSVFSEIISEDRYYVDKTKFIYDLAERGKFYFLSRPRRFGKTLFLDTLREAFLGNKALFRGLFLENHWDWDKKYPVIHISFGGGVDSGGKLKIRLNELIEENADRNDIKLNSESIEGKFRELFKRLSASRNEKVVLLIDEYDKPLLDNISKIELAKEIRDILRGFYSVIKDSDRYIKFVFITGVSKFSKVSIFSGLNNLQDITLDKRYATLCGYTHQELITTFEERLENVDLSKLKRWYNGYNFLGEKVYNPYDVLLYLDTGELKAHWFETGTPTFLVKLLQERKYYIPQLELIEVSDNLISSFDIERIEVETLMFQAGYLTIKEKKIIGNRIKYILTYPNLEVKISLLDFLLNYLVDNVAEKEKNEDKIYEALVSGDLDRLQEIFYSFFAGIPYDWYRKNELSKYEGYYASIFYSYFTALGLDVRVEDASNYGRVDMAVLLDDKIYLLEFKVVEIDKSLGSALNQIKEKKYYEKYLSEEKQIYLIGVEFSKKDRNIVRYEWEKYEHIR